MSEQPRIKDLTSGKLKLSYAEKRSNYNKIPVFRCPECGLIEDIPPGVLINRYKDKVVQRPAHHNNPMHLTYLHIFCYNYS